MKRRISIIAIACRIILKRIILFAYFLLNSPPCENPPTPTIRTIKTARQANITKKNKGLPNVNSPIFLMA